MPSAIVQPPKPGACAHCGRPVPTDNYVRQYTIEGTGIEVPVTHCLQCLNNEDCATTCKEEK